MSLPIEVAGASPAMTARTPRKPMSPRPLPRPGVLEIEAYVPGKSGAPGVAKFHKLSSNETPLGPSPQAIEAVRRAAGELESYPEGTAAAPRGAVAAKPGPQPAPVGCGAGAGQ